MMIKIHLQHDRGSKLINSLKTLARFKIHSEEITTVPGASVYFFLRIDRIFNQNSDSKSILDEFSLHEFIVIWNKQRNGLLALQCFGELAAEAVQVEAFGFRLGQFLEMAPSRQKAEMQVRVLIMGWPEEGPVEELQLTCR